MEPWRGEWAAKSRLSVQFRGGISCPRPASLSLKIPNIAVSQAVSHPQDNTLSPRDRVA